MQGYKTGYSYRGIGLLQPGKAESSKPVSQNQLGSSNVSRGLRPFNLSLATCCLFFQSSDEQEIDKSTKSHPVPEKELWEFVADRKVKVVAVVKFVWEIYTGPYVDFLKRGPHKGHG